ncbi:MAG: hypothetical protein NTW48_07150 [Chloroflexi bacterium]|nr:hypothetical protein [Chloroflexota bacterium]
MAHTGRRIPVRIGATLETIEEHLKEQDREAKRRRWVAFVAVGLSVMVAGASLLLGKYVGYILLLYGFAMMLYGIARASKIK